MQTASRPISMVATRCLKNHGDFCQSHIVRNAKRTRLRTCREPLMPSKLPSYPWEKVGTDDIAYRLFKEIEIDLQGKLKDHLIQPIPDDSKEDLIRSVVSNDNVQFYWSTVSIDIDDQVVSRDLLLEIIDRWLTIRGFSVAREWMEMYKRCRSTVKQKRSLNATEEIT